MFLKRLFPTRWAKILVWIGAGVTWGSVAIAAEVDNPTVAQADEPEPTPPATATADTLAPVPTIPDSGLVVIRYTPVAAPEPEVIVRTVSAPSAPAAQAPVVRSSGS